MNPYAANKALAHPSILEALARGENPSPAHLQLILTNRCNHNCSFCAYRMDGYASAQDFHVKDEITLTDALIIITYFADMGGKALQLTGGGEPLVHPHFCEIVDYAHHRGLQVGVVTNGSRMGEREREALSDAAWVRVSIDAGTPETYAKVRHVRPEMFTRAIENLRQLRGPYRGIGFVVTEDNWREIPQIVEIAEDLGVDSLRLAAIFSTEGADYYRGFGDEAAELCRKAAEKPFVTDNFAVRFADLQQGAPDYERCAYQHFTTYIGADMNLYRCCVTSYNERGLVGSLRDETLPNLWQRMSEPFDARGCECCQFNDRNRAMNQLIDSYPTLHADFV